MDSCELKPNRVDVCVDRLELGRHKPLTFEIFSIVLNQPLLFVFVQAELILIFTTQSPKGRDAFFKTITNRVWILHPQKRRKETFNAKNWSKLPAIQHYTWCQIGRLMPKLKDDVINLTLTLSIRRTSSCRISIFHHNQWQIQHFPKVAPTPMWGRNLLFGKITAKNCIKGKENGPRKKRIITPSTEHQLMVKHHCERCPTFRNILIELRGSSDIFHVHVLSVI